MFMEEKVKKMNCIKCNCMNDEEAKFCWSCGEELSREKECIMCGKINSISSAFCANCGSSLIIKEEFGNTKNNKVNLETVKEQQIAKIDNYEPKTFNLSGSKLQTYLKKPVVLVAIFAIFVALIVRIHNNSPEVVVKDLYHAVSVGDYQAIEENSTTYFISNEIYEINCFDHSPEDGYEFVSTTTTSNGNTATVHLTVYEMDQKAKEAYEMENDITVVPLEMTFSLVRDGRTWLVNDVSSDNCW